MTGSKTFEMVRPLGLGLGWARLEAVVGLVRAGTDAAAREWDARHGPCGGDVGDVSVHARARALGWEQHEAVPEGPWEGDRSFFVGRHDGRWRVTLPMWGAPYAENHAIAVGVGLASLHGPAMRIRRPGCWVFASHGVTDGGERQAIQEAVRFADALLLPDDALRAAAERYRDTPAMIMGELRAPIRAVERRMRRLGIAVPWEEVPAAGAQAVA